MEALRLTRAASGVVCQDCGRLTVGLEAGPCPHCRSQHVEKRERLLPPELQRLGFHDLRHHFISYAVMSGIDFMTIAKWVGHQDGGVLIGRVYGHLADDHRRAAAARLNFGPRIMALPTIPVPASPTPAGQSNAG
jgi:integrase